MLKFFLPKENLLFTESHTQTRVGDRLFGEANLSHNGADSHEYKTRIIITLFLLAWLLSGDESSRELSRNMRFCINIYGGIVFVAANFIQIHVSQAWWDFFRCIRKVDVSAGLLFVHGFGVSGIWFA